MKWVQMNILWYCLSLGLEGKKEVMLSDCGAGEGSWGHLDCKETKPVNFKRNQPWTFTGRTDAEAEAPILWPPDLKNLFIGKDTDDGKDWKQNVKGMAKDEMVI